MNVFQYTKVCVWLTKELSSFSQGLPQLSSHDEPEVLSCDQKEPMTQHHNPTGGTIADNTAICEITVQISVQKEWIYSAASHQTHPHYNE